MTHLCLTLALCAAPVPAESKGTPATIFVARKIVTMERRQPTATAVAVAGDRVVAVGTLDEVQAATRRYKTQIDRTFADKVILPGFVATGRRAEGATPRAGITSVASSESKGSEGMPFRTISLAEPLSAAEVARTGQALWDAGRQIRCRGDVDAALDALERLCNEKPTDDHRFVVESSQKWSAARCQRLAKLGGLALIDPRESSGAGALVKNKAPVALYCVKEPIAPLALLSALSGAEDRVAEALRTVTCNAAFVLRQEKQIGSIAPGKKADFVVLEQDPLGVPLKLLKDVAVWGTVFEGKKHPARQAAGWDERPKRLADRPSGSTVRHVTGLFGDDTDPRRAGKCDPSCPCRGGPRSKTPPLNPTEPRRGR